MLNEVLGYILLIVVIAIHSYRTYQLQEYWLDRQVAKFIRFLKSLWHNDICNNHQL